MNVAMTIKAFAVKGGMTDSAVMSESYTISATPPSVTPPRDNDSDSSGSSYTQPAYTYGSITVYGVRADYSIENATGLLTLNLTRNQLDSIIKAAGDDVTHIALNLTSVSGVKGLTYTSRPRGSRSIPASPSRCGRVSAA